MKIILNKDVQNLGEEGDVKEVAPGYARNYLIPKGFGVTYTKQNLALLEGKRKAIEKRKEEKKDHAAGLRERIEALSLQITMTVGENGRLFGSVTNAMIADELAKLGIEVERKRVEIPDHTIKNAGNHVVKVKLYGSAVASLKVTVAGPAGKAGAASTAEAPAEAAPGGEPEAAEATVDEVVQPEEQASEAPATEETAVDESSAAEETAAEEPAVAEDSTTEETAAEEPAAAEGSTTEEAAAEEPAVAEDSTTQEPAVEESPATEEAPSDDGPAGEGAQEPVDEAPQEAVPSEPPADEAGEEPADHK